MKKFENIAKKVVCSALVATMSLSLGAFCLNTNAYTAHSASDTVNWATSQVNKSLDYDGKYGAQCVDLIAYYYKYLGTSTPGGNGVDYSWNRLPSGWSRIKYSSGVKPQAGDIAVWNNGTYGHVGIVTNVYSSGFDTIEQNYSGQWCEKVSRSYSAARQKNNLVCFIRPDFGGSNSSSSSYSSVNIKMESTGYTDAYSSPNGGSYVGRVWPGDVITIKKIYDNGNGYLEISCPWVTNGQHYDRTVYVRANQLKLKAGKYINAYNSSGQKIGRAYPDDTLSNISFSNGRMKCDCPWSGGTTKTIFLNVCDIG